MNTNDQHPLPPPPRIPQSIRWNESIPPQRQIIVYRYPDGAARLRMVNWKGKHRDDEGPVPFAQAHADASRLAEFLEWPLNVIDVP